ncbi:MAG: hypothetical protein ACP5QP_02140 [Brevinematia bacterium]
MKKSFFVLLVIKFIIVLVYPLFAEPVEGNVSISIPDDEITYLVIISNFESISIESINELKSIEVDGNKVTPIVSKYGEIFNYRLNLDEKKVSKIKITYKYEISRNIPINSFIILSEVTRTLPYVEEVKNQAIKVEIDLGNSDYQIFCKGNIFSNKNISFTKNYGDPIAIGYFSVVSSHYKSKILNAIVPQGVESIGVDILSWTSISVENIEKDLYKLPIDNINIIYYPKAPFSESINDTIILSKIQPSSIDYFSDVERIEGIITIIHELLHKPLGINIDENFIDIIEGFIQFIAIEQVGKIFGEEIKQKIYKNYILQLKYLTLNDSNIKELIRYRKYPLIFRYVFFLTGEVNYISLYKYLSSSDKFIDSNFFWSTFKNLTGIKGENFTQLFDNTPTLWNLNLYLDDRNLTIRSTAPIEVNVELELIYEDSTNISVVEIPKDEEYKLYLNKEPRKIALNRNLQFPEIFVSDNYINREIPSFVKSFVELISYTLNTKDFSLIKKRKVVYSDSLFSKLRDYAYKKEEMFDKYDIKLVVENIYRYNNNVIVELTMFYKGIYFRVCILTLGYGKSYYIKDFSIF